MNKPPEDDEFDHDVDEDDEEDDDDDDDESSTFQMADPPVRNPSAGTVRNPSAAGAVPKKEEVPRPPAAKTRPPSGRDMFIFFHFVNPNIIMCIFNNALNKELQYISFLLLQTSLFMLFFLRIRTPWSRLL